MPFVPFEIISDDDKDEIAEMPLSADLDGRSDLYCYITAKIADVIKPGGTLGFIVSNSWLGTNMGIKFIKFLRQKYNLKQMHISGRGRWFKNADVVTAILVLEKKKDLQSVDTDTDFWLWKMSLDTFAEDSEAENTLVNSALPGTEINPSSAKMSRYSQKQIDDILTLSVSYNSLLIETLFAAACQSVI